MLAAWGLHPAGHGHSWLLKSCQPWEGVIFDCLKQQLRHKPRASTASEGQSRDSRLGHPRDDMFSKLLALWQLGLRHFISRIAVRNLAQLTQRKLGF